MDKESRLDAESVDEEEESSLPEYFITTRPVDYPLEVLWSKYKNGEIIVPKFQREFVWTIPQASRLVESFIVGLPVPPLYLYENEEHNLLVIDGVQRLHTVSSFLDGKILGTDKTFRLQRMSNKRLVNKTFQCLPERYQRLFKNTVLRCTIIRQTDPRDGGSSMYQIFSRLNTGGTDLKPQEIRNCVYAGPLTDAITELNKEKKWRAVLGEEKLHKRKKDEELILKYMALFHNVDSYKEPMKAFLDDFMKRNREPNKRFLDGEKSRFLETCDAVMKHLGKNAFDYKKNFRSAMFDAIFVAFANNTRDYPTDMRERLDTLKENQEFVDASKQRTTNTDNVKRRLELAQSILFG